MLNEEKIKLMTKLAIYEQGEGKEAIKCNKYSKGDYVSLHMIKAAVVVTVAYLLVVSLWMLHRLEAFINQLISVRLVNLGIKMFVLYVIVFIIYMLVTYMVYSMKYIRMQEKNKGYSDELKELYLMYKREEKNKSEMKLGGIDTDDSTFKY